MKKVLFIATVVKTHIMEFHIPYLELFGKNGYEVHVAARNDYDNKEDCNIPYCDNFFDLPFERSPFKRDNLIVFKELKKVIDSNEYEIIHCHTPIGGAIGRLTAKRARDNGTKVIYTAHGFHFYKGAPLNNWVLYYAAEKILARDTDVLITINEEDYNTAVKKKFKAGRIEYVRGVGIDLDKFIPQTSGEKKELRKQYSYSDEDFILICVAELNHNKHQDLLIYMMAKLVKKIPNIKLLLVGRGELFDEYFELIKTLGIESNVKILGYRNDVSNLMKLSDVAVSSSRREGLPLSVMEAMATGLPLVVSNCRGNRDLVRHDENGFIYEIDNDEEFINSV